MRAKFFLVKFLKLTGDFKHFVALQYVKIRPFQQNLEMHVKLF